MLPTLRRSIVATFGAFVLFLFADAAFGRIVDPADPFDAIGHVHPEIALAHRIVSFSTTIVFLAVVLGGLPLLLTAMKHALSGGPRSVVRLFGMRPKQVLRWLRVALLITICSLGFLLATQAIFGPPPCTSTNGCLAGQPPLGVALGFTALIGGGTLGVFVVLMLSASLSLAVLRSEFGTGMLRFALVLLGILALSMATASVATAMWTIRLWVDAPQFAASTSGLGNGQTAWVIAIIAAMAVSTVVAVGAFTSGLRASWGRAG
jgi:hypothetical protein